MLPAASAVALAVALSTDCAYPTHYEVYVLDGVPRAWVAEAVAEWSTFTDATFDVWWAAPGTFECDNDCLVVHRASKAVVAAKCVPDSIGCTVVDGPRDSAHVWLADPMPDSIGPEVAIHEFGHALGLEHACAGGTYQGHPCPRVTSSPTVMNPIAGASALHVTCDDVQQYADVHGGGWNCNDARLGAAGALHLAP